MRLLIIVILSLFCSISSVVSAGEGGQTPSFWVRQVNVAVIDEAGLPLGYVKPNQPFSLALTYDMPNALPEQELTAFFTLQGENIPSQRVQSDIVITDGKGVLTTSEIYVVQDSGLLTVSAYIYTGAGYELLVDTITVVVTDNTIMLPPDRVIVVGSEFLEFEFHGEYPMSPTVALYQHDGGEAIPIPMQRFIVGTGAVQATVYQDEIFRIDIMEPPVVDRIRVALTTDQFTSTEHTALTLTADGPFIVEERRTERGFFLQAGEGVIVTAQNDKLIFVDPEGEHWEFTSRVYVTPINTGKLQIDSFKRGTGSGFYPQYRGVFEFTPVGNGRFQVINEVSLEEYLYQVVPSEMPYSWHLEALKSQAVAARTFAVAQAINSRQGAKGFHVDDSTSSQVYNNQREAPQTTAAINATTGEILIDPCGSITSTYFYSTSPEDEASPWYQWEFSLAKAELTTLFSRTLNTKIGEVVDLKIIEQNRYGYVTKLQIEGTEGQVTINGELNIRMAIRPHSSYTGGESVMLSRTGGLIANQSLMPSSHFTLDKSFDEQGELQSVAFRGSGSGHGLGMSQWGARALAEQGESYKVILQKYYPTKELIIYE